MFIEQALEGFILLDEQGAVIEFNHGIEMLTGLCYQDVVGRSFLEIMEKFGPFAQIPAEHKEKVKGYVAQALQTGESPILARPYE